MKVEGMVHWLCRFGLAGLLLLLTHSCSQKPKQHPTEQVPADFSVVFGEGGGFTGLWQGYTIKADGTVLKWQGRIAEQNPRQVGRLHRKEQLDLWQQIQRLNYFSMVSHERGNITRFTRVTADERTHEVSWVGGRGASTSASALQELYRFCQRTVEKLSNK